MPNALRTDYIAQMGREPTTARMNALNIRGAEQNIQQQGEMFPLQMQKMKAELDAMQFKDEEDAIQWWNERKGFITPENFETMKDSAIMKGANPALFPDPAEFQGPDGPAA